MKNLSKAKMPTLKDKLLGGVSVQKPVAKKRRIIRSPKPKSA